MALAYNTTESIAAVESFMIQAPELQKYHVGAITIKHQYIYKI
jgi:hypothetical protein